MKDVKYQNDAIKELVEKTITALNISGHRHKIIFKAPTGSGKTYMASVALQNIVEDLANRSDSKYRQCAFIWIAPNKLHQQSYFKMKGFFSETRILRPVMFDELDQSDAIIHPGEILFVNWESVNKENNLMVRDSEQGSSLYDITRNTQEMGLPIVVVIDEEHLFWSKTADKSANVLNNINPKVEIRISATPKTHSDTIINIPRDLVIAEEMIKRGVILNPDVDKKITEGEELNIHLIKLALARRQQLADAYKRLGVNINPLLLIQLPNDTSDSMTTEDSEIAETVKLYLEHQLKEKITTDNGKLAVWLSKEKKNLEGLEANDNLVQVLLFKQAIALGWDCPRAAVLLIFRKLESAEFSVQTVGRILRMPEQKFYPEDILNLGYVYTDVSKDRIQIIAEDMNYLSKDSCIATRRDSLLNVSLPSTYIKVASASRNRLGPDFKKTLLEIFNRELLSGRHDTQTRMALFENDEEITENNPVIMDIDTTLSPQVWNRNEVSNKFGITFDVKNINVSIPKDLVFQNDEGYTDKATQIKYARTYGEIHRVFLAYCSSLLGKFERAHSTDVLYSSIAYVMEELFEVFETDVAKIILYNKNKLKFTDVITKALDTYADKVKKRKEDLREHNMITYNWEVPPERVYIENTNTKIDDVQNHSLLPFYRLNNAFNPEINFEEFLEQNSQYIDWWYKNGDSGKEHYAIPYNNISGNKSLFYVDFVIRMKDGTIFLFDSKTSGSDLEAPNKHNALIDYMTANSSKNLKGGILIFDGHNWKYSPYYIENTTDIAAWDAFFPDQYGA